MTEENKNKTKETWKDYKSGSYSKVLEVLLAVTELEPEQDNTIILGGIHKSCIICIVHAGNYICETEKTIVTNFEYSYSYTSRRTLKYK